MSEVSPYLLLLSPVLARWELLLLACVVAILLVARWISGLMNGLGKGMSEFRKELDRQAHDVGRAAGGISGKSAAEALTPDNQTAELYDPSVFRKHRRRRTVRQFLRDLWRNLVRSRG